MVLEAEDKFGALDADEDGVVAVPRLLLALLRTRFENVPAGM